MGTRLGMMMALTAAVSGAAGIAPGSDQADALSILNILAHGGVGQMKYKFGGEPGAEDPSVDDSSWETVYIGYAWRAPDTNVWFRTVLDVPERFGGFSLAGREATITLKVDNAYDVFVNGDPIAAAVERQGQSVLPARIQAGRRYVIAIRGINRTGPGKLYDAQIEFSGMEGFQRQLRQHVECLFTAKRYAQRFPDEWQCVAKEVDHIASKVVASAAYQQGCAEEFIKLVQQEVTPIKAALSQWLAFHQTVYDEQGVLLPWTSWDDALKREMDWYQRCPVEGGYPRFVTMTFMSDAYELESPTFIPATQNGMGIISYLKYYHYTKKQNANVLRVARLMGDYLIKESLTPDTGKYPRFTRSTGWAGKMPQPPDCGSQGDRPYEIEPDKGGIAGYALMLLFAETHDRAYLDQALQNARVLAANMRAGDEHRSPWPFRVDYRTGEYRGEVAGNTSFILRLFDQLIERGYDEFEGARQTLWDWVVKYQIPNAAGDGSLWVQFFEDHEELDNRTAWSALNMARYLIENQARVDPEWQRHAKMLIEFVQGNFTSVVKGVRVCGEQDHDKNPWGGVLANYGGVLAMYSAATGSDEYKSTAFAALNFCLYSIDKRGCPAEGYWCEEGGGWQEDCHTDKIHNYLDAIGAFPEWASTVAKTPPSAPPAGPP